MPAPQLRFKQFKGSGEWEEKPLSHYLHEHKLKSDGESEVYSVSVHKGVINQVEHLGRSFAASDTSKYNLARPFDIIYTKSPTGDFPYGIVKQNLSGSKVIVSPLYGVFEPKNQHVGYLIHAYFEEAARANNYLSPLIQKGAKNTIQISNERFATGYFYLPSNEAEQKRVAEFLVSLDAVITAHTDKLDALRQHKRALMQQLFPQEGEKVPRLRFPEFEESGEWEEKKLGEIAPLQRGFDLPNSQLVAGNIPVVYSNGIQNYHNISVAQGPGLLTGRSGTIGKLHFIESGPYWPHNTTLWVTGFNGNNPKFIYYLYSLIGFLRFSSGSGVPTLNRNDAHAYITTIPTLPEQTHIAACLSFLDDLISAQSEKIDELKTFKRGLMQGLFPSTTNHEATE